MLRVEVGEIARLCNTLWTPNKGDANQTLTRPRTSDTCREGTKKLNKKEWRRMAQLQEVEWELLMTLRMSHS